LAKGRKTTVPLPNFATLPWTARAWRSNFRAVHGDLA
jgi:hypothetical protein